MPVKRPKSRCARVVHGRAPLRINDIGGWTDTWFAGEGKVLNLAVMPAVDVEVRAVANLRTKAERVIVHAENYGESFSLNPEKPDTARHPLIQFAVGSVSIPKEMGLEISLFSAAPAGISTGTSASVCVALLGALYFLMGRSVSPYELAALAHRVETEKLKKQSGIQDQICAAFGGILFIDMFSYPRARVERLELKSSVWNELSRRLCLVYLGQPHQSSSIHEQVIARLEKGGREFKQIDKMRGLAEEAKHFLLGGDLESYGKIMIRNNECQRALYPQLICRDADRVAGIARKFGAAGWKVNGAGGKGGSLTILASSDDGLRREMLREISALGRGIKPLPAFLSSSGFEVWEVRRPDP